MLLVVSDASFERIPGVKGAPTTYFLFVVDHWEKSKTVSQQLLDQIEKDAGSNRTRISCFAPISLTGLR